MKGNGKVFLESNEHLPFQTKSPWQTQMSLAVLLGCGLLTAVIAIIPVGK